MIEFDNVTITQPDAARPVLAGVTGEPNDNPDSSTEVQEIFFDLVARTANTMGADAGAFTTQWQFTDADPWHLVVDNGSGMCKVGGVGRDAAPLPAGWLRR